MTTTFDGVRHRLVPWCQYGFVDAIHPGVLRLAGICRDVRRASGGRISLTPTELNAVVEARAWFRDRCQDDCERLLVGEARLRERLPENHRLLERLYWVKIAVLLFDALVQRGRHPLPRYPIPWSAFARIERTEKPPPRPLGPPVPGDSPMYALYAPVSRSAGELAV